MIGEDINTDLTLRELEQQIELLEAIEDRNPLFAEQLRTFREARALIMSQILQLRRLEELIDWDAVPDYDGIIGSTYF